MENTQKVVKGVRDGGLLHMKMRAPRLDAARVGEFKSNCAEFFDPSVREVEIDMADVEFVDSLGIGALLGLMKRLETKNPNVKLVNLQPQVQSALELLRLQRVFEFDA